jgi:AcrR family transcriptional regulator
MGRPVLTDDQVAAFRKRACDVAMRLFRDEGYEHFSLRTLARELDCSHGTPYRYFTDKAEVFAVVRAEGFRQFEAFLRARLGGASTPLEQLRTLGQAYFDFAGSQSAAFTVIFAMGQPDPAEYAFVAKAARDAWHVLLDVVRSAVQSGLLAGDIDELAHVMWAGIHGVASLHLAQKLVMGRGGASVVEAMMQAFIRAHRVQPETATISAPSRPRSVSRRTSPSGARR